MQHKNVKHGCKTKRVEKVKHKETWKVKRNSDTLIVCNTKEVQNEKKCSTKKTWKVKEIAKHKRIAIRETCNMERLQHEEVPHEERATRKKYNLKVVQHERSIAAEHNLEKKCQGRVQYSAQRNGKRAVC